MSLSSWTILISAAFLILTETGLASVEAQCADTTVTAQYSRDIPLVRVESPFGYWMLDGYEVRVEKATILSILDTREARIERSGLRSYGSAYLRRRVNSLSDSQWPVDMETLIPPSSAWDHVKRPEPAPETYLKSEFYILSMQRQGHSLILENALYHGVAEVHRLDGQRLGHIKRYSFSERLKDNWTAVGHVWVDPDGVNVYVSCRMDPASDS